MYCYCFSKLFFGKRQSILSACRLFLIELTVHALHDFFSYNASLTRIAKTKNIDGFTETDFSVCGVRVFTNYQTVCF